MGEYLQVIFTPPSGRSTIIILIVILGSKSPNISHSRCLRSDSPLSGDQAGNAVGTLAGCFNQNI